MLFAILEVALVDLAIPVLDVAFEARHFVVGKGAFVLPLISAFVLA